MNARYMSLLYFSSFLTLEFDAIGRLIKPFSSFDDEEPELENEPAESDFRNWSRTAIVLGSIFTPRTDWSSGPVFGLPTWLLKGEYLE